MSPANWPDRLGRSSFRGRGQGTGKTQAALRRWVRMTDSTVWRCEQWVGGSIKEQNLFRSEEAAREFARALAGVSPDLVLKIEPMPLQMVWN